MRLVTGINLLLTLGILGDSKTTQPNSAEGAEEEPVHLPCNHSTISGPEYVYWYRQISHQGPEYLIHGLNNNVTNKMASLSIAKDRKSSILVLPQVTVRDTAVYYCILRDTHWDRWGCTCANHLKATGTLHSATQRRAGVCRSKNRSSFNQRSASVMLRPGLLWVFMAAFGLSTCGPEPGTSASP
ncbi:unnamed protein product [Rangifer tarandus platyrhynchus]|uniref:Ig-like domain-containing protein n=1 Tax=Rangifer tarandus platyrhynchus TaxID=3082113 RepID=A0ABN8ZRD3_RANTA|nr:unnamed protein product [Rangifer tarandus platyrhynchus]